MKVILTATLEDDGQVTVEIKTNGAEPYDIASVLGSIGRSLVSNKLFTWEQVHKGINLGKKIKSDDVLYSGLTPGGPGEPS